MHSQTIGISWTFLGSFFLILALILFPFPLSYFFCLCLSSSFSLEVFLEHTVILSCLFIFKREAPAGPRPFSGVSGLS